MQIKVIRNQFTRNSTIGDFIIDGVHNCFTLELPVPPSWPGVKGQCCVPPGIYQVTLSKYRGTDYDWMVKLCPAIEQYGMLLISNIPGRTYPRWTTANDGIPEEGIDARRTVYIHVGNTVKDTLGCLVTGLAKSVDRIDQSTAAFNKIFPQIAHAISSGEPVTIEYC